MSSNRRLIFPALIAAGVLWGTTVPLSKVALGWMPPAWLAFARFALAAAILMVVSRSRLRAACSPAILVTGGLGYGGSVLLQNLGIERTSVTHAALLIGATPVLVAIIAATLRHSVARPVAWVGFGMSLAGVGFIASGQGSGSTLGGDGLVLAAQFVSASFTVSQARLLRGRDPLAVTALQLMSAAVLVLPVALTTEQHLAGSMSATALLATIGLVVGGTVGPTALFAFGQSKVAADVAGAFLNIEPLIGAAMGTVLFADPLGPVQLVGGLAIMAGIGLSSYQVALDERGHRAASVAPSEVVLAGATEPELDAAGEPVLAAADESVLTGAGERAALRIAPAAAGASLQKPGEAPSLVKKSRFPHPHDEDAARYARRLGPAGHASPGARAGGRRSGASRRPGAVRRSATGRRRDGDSSPDRRRQRRRATR
ncbi:MAG TPA: DMT family transporter [Streptosporangiaceae bacterium]|nr:DMT family transporter [Streptosporangiaceae bacterium]